MKRIASIFLVICLLVTMAGCSGRKKNHTNTAGQSQTQNAEVPIYQRSSSPFRLLEDANPYMVSFGTEGLFYYVVEKPDEENGNETQEEWVPNYNFYYQTYDKSPAISYGTVTGGIIGDISSVVRDDKLRSLLLHLTDEEAHLLELGEDGKVYKDILLDSGFHTYEKVEEILAVDEGYVISLDHEVFLLDHKGEVVKTTDAKYAVLELIGADSETIYALGYDKASDQYEQYLLMIDREAFARKDAVRLDEKVTAVFPFADGIVSVYNDRIEFFHPGKADGRAVIDLDKQEILSSEIRFICGTQDAYRIVTLDGTAGCLLTLRESTESGEDTDSQTSDKNYTEDGRRIVRVAVAEDFLWNMTFHAKKYNKTTETTYIEVTELNESMELYLGKGNKPDIICLNITTDFLPYIEKKALANLLPFFEQQEMYSMDEMVPKARELLTYDEGQSVYYIAPYFQLLLHASDGTEYNENGYCDINDYLLWRDHYMEEKDLCGIENRSERFMPEYLLYANLGEFYDEVTATVSFSSDAFKKMMKTYKDTSARRNGELDQLAVYQEYGSLCYEILRGPGWYMSYDCIAMSHPQAQMEELPGIDGRGHVYMRLYTGMGILETSECKQEAFDFLMYYATLYEHLGVSTPENWYGHSGRRSVFSIFEEYINETTFETEDRYCDAGFYYREDQLDQLRYLIDIAEPDTQTRQVIFDMMMEEMDPYLNGNKDLDSACEILDSRVRLYLQERK